ncbi:MAG: ribosomal protein S18-alanine N-acetyltransferase [Clostridia bacterium]|nr:ribosomal protein S18-alanine N-acetyltransferase [Clostridia bacterium]
MEIRRAVASDAPKIALAEDLIFSDAWSERDVQSTICTEGGICYVATDGDVLRGYILGRLIPPEGEIYRIAVLPEYRRRGIAYRLLDYAVKTERGRGLECLFLEVRAKNIAARSLYLSYGFRDMGVRKNYYKNPTDDAIIMRRAHPDDMKN